MQRRPGCWVPVVQLSLHSLSHSIHQTNPLTLSLSADHDDNHVVTGYIDASLGGGSHAAAIDAADTTPALHSALSRLEAAKEHFRDTLQFYLHSEASEADEAAAEDAFNAASDASVNDGGIIVAISASASLDDVIAEINGGAVAGADEEPSDSVGSALAAVLDGLEDAQQTFAFQVGCCIAVDAFSRALTYRAL